MYCTFIEQVAQVEVAFGHSSTDSTLSKEELTNQMAKPNLEKLNKCY
jgi:hypothetical protein